MLYNLSMKRCSRLRPDLNTEILRLRLRMTKRSHPVSALKQQYQTEAHQKEGPAVFGAFHFWIL